MQARNIKLYVSSNGYSYQEVEDWTVEEMEDGGLRLLLHTPTQARYVKVQSLFDDRDVNFDPVNKAEFKNQAKDLIDVYYLVTDRQEEYQYDAGGNRSQATITTRQGKQTNYEYYPNSNRLMANGEYGFSYDANGNLIAKGTKYTNSGTNLKIQPEGEYWNYHYDLLNRLIAVEKNGKTITAYKYNEQGLRIKKLAPETTTYYSFNQEGQVVYEQTSETSLSYVYVLGQHFAMVEGKEKYFYHTDHLGSTVLVTNEAGQTLWDSEYTPFGQLTIETSLFAHAMKFTGKDLDLDTGLYYFNARWYDASLGRFISEDPIKDGLNWYAYVNNNPLVYVDPTGLFIIGTGIGFTSTTIIEVQEHYESTGYLIEDLRTALSKTFTDPKSLAKIGTSTALGAVTSGVSSFSSKLLTTGATSVAKIVGTRIAVDTVVGGLDAGVHEVLQSIIEGNEINANEVLTAMSHGAVISGGISVLGNTISNFGRQTIIDTTGDPVRGKISSLRNPKITVLEPIGSAAAVGTAVESLFTIASDIIDYIFSKEEPEVL